MFNPKRIRLLSPALTCLLLLTWGLLACSSKPKTTSKTEEPASLDDLVIESDWIGEVWVDPAAVSNTNGTVRIQIDHAIKDFASLSPDSIDIPWPFGPENPARRDSGSYFLLLRKGADGRFLKPESDRSAFRLLSYDSADIGHSYVRYFLSKGFPAAEPTRAAVAAFGPDSGIERYRFYNYSIETLVFKILADNDSAHYGFLEDHSGFQSNNADIMLHYLAETGHYEMVGKFITLGNYVDFSDHNLLSPMWICMSKRSVPCMDTLLAYGSNLNLVTPDDNEETFMTPIHGAVNLEHPALVRWLRGHGAGLYYRDKYGQMPIHKAACSDSGVLEIIAYANDSLSAKDGNGKTAFDLARACGNKKNEAFLVEAVRKIPAADPSRNRVSALAAEYRPGKGLYDLPRKERIRIAGESMYDLVRLGCGLQGMEFGMSAKEADAVCDALLTDSHARATLGPALAGTLEKRFAPKEVDTLLVHYIQISHGNGHPTWISNKVNAGTQELFAMRRKFQEMILQAMIEVMMRGKDGTAPSHQVHLKPGPSVPDPS